MVSDTKKKQEWTIRGRVVLFGHSIRHRSCTVFMCCEADLERETKKIQKELSEYIFENVAKEDMKSVRLEIEGDIL